MKFAAATGEAGLTLEHERLEGVLSFLVSRSSSSSRALSPMISDVLSGCAMQVRGILCTMIETRSRAEYRREFQQSFPKYVGLTLAMSHFATAMIPREEIERLSRESICEMESYFRDNGIEAFGEVVRNQAIFTVWTLRKINDVVDQIMAAKLEDSKKKADSSTCAMFNVHLFRAQFSLDCLNLALETKKALYPDVVEDVTDGLKSMVNAYAHAREGLELRVPVKETDIAVSELDEEDRALLEMSMRSANEFASH